MKTLLEGLNWRRAIKKFDLTKKISDADLGDILMAGNLMPTAYGLQPFRFVVIADHETKEKLVEHAYGQRHVAENSHLVVICARTDFNEAMMTEYAERSGTIRNLPAENVEKFAQGMLKDLGSRTPEAQLAWAQKQAYIALGGMFAMASEKGIDCHGLEGFNPAKFNEILGLTELNLHASVLLALGYRPDDVEAEQLKKVRVLIEQMVIKK